MASKRKELVGAEADSGHTVETRAHLLLSAERLFAERGIETVPLRDVHRAAGQRNASAVNYHFGGKDALVRAIVEFRAEATNARRRQLLDELERSAPSADVHGLVRVLVTPLAEHVAAGDFYVGFLSRMLTESGLDRPIRSGSDPAWSSAAQVGRHLRTSLEHVERPVFDLRFRLALDLIVHDLATYQIAVQRDSPAMPPLEQHAAQLVDAVTGLLQGPHPPMSPSSSLKESPGRQRSV